MRKCKEFASLNLQTLKGTSYHLYCPKQIVRWDVWKIPLNFIAKMNRTFKATCFAQESNHGMEPFAFLQRPSHLWEERVCFKLQYQRRAVESVGHKSSRAIVELLPKLGESSSKKRAKFSRGRVTGTTTPSHLRNFKESGAYDSNLQQGLR
ncbi:hypothetical protein SUGI_1135200 [Cryptomeria japonica]|nr:hypothetical protein SUGI_1135200 [Cryptomeria japonica]